MASSDSNYMELLIRLVQYHPKIYDETNPDYKDTARAHNIWLEIAEIVDRGASGKYWLFLCFLFFIGVSIIKNMLRNLGLIPLPLSSCLAH